MALTKKDRDDIGTIVGQAIAANNQILIEHIDILIEEKLDEKLDEKLGKYPNKDEFYTQTDALMKEIKDLREETTIHNHQVQRNTNKIEKLEKIVVTT